MAGLGADDILYGGDGRDVLFGDSDEQGGGGGASGDDALYGGDGGDDLLGAKGDDTLYGGAGHDELFGDACRDVIVGPDPRGGGPHADERGAIPAGIQEKVVRQFGSSGKPFPQVAEELGISGESPRVG